jgi:hypothetical protein
MDIRQRVQQFIIRRPSLAHFIVFLLAYITTASVYQHFLSKATMPITLSLAVTCSVISGFITYGHQSMCETFRRCAQDIATKPSIQEVLTYGVIIVASLGAMGDPESRQGIEVLRIADFFTIAIVLWIAVNLAVSCTGMHSAITRVARWFAILSVFRACLSVYIDPLIANAWAMRDELTLGLIVIIAFSLSHSFIGKLGRIFQQPIKALGTVSTQPNNPPSEDDMRRIAAHEAAHALVYAGLKELPGDLEIHCLDKLFGNSLGYVTGYSSPNILPDLNYVRWQMLVYLAGKEGEIMVMSQASLGCSTDYEHWEALAKIYLSTADDVTYFAKPSSETELLNNTLQLNLLKKADITLLKCFLRLNENVYAKLVENIVQEKVLAIAAIKPYLDQVIFPENFPQQVI